VTLGRLAPLARLRLQLTLWYGGVFVLILAGLGGGLFLAVRAQLSRELDESLRRATAELQRAARIREIERARATGPVADAVEELRIPDRSLYLLDSAGLPIVPAHAPKWVTGAARQAAAQGTADLTLEVSGDRTIRLHVERFVSGSGLAYVAAVAADRSELEQHYASLIGVFGAAALVALLLVAGGGYLLVHVSTRPVERAMEQMRRFMADAAHELRTPVTLLRTRAEVALRQDRDPERDAAALRAVRREAERLGSVVGDLLMLARADAGERAVARESVYLDDLAAGAVEGIRALAETHGVQVEVGDFEEAPITGDATLIRRLLVILLDNAIKFTPAGGKVRLDVAARDGRRAVVITDTGPGIPAAELPHVFERFYRGAGTGQGTDGAGLGLAIARWIADAHSARLDITSLPPPASGTRVRVEFPGALSAS
jgi:signal transduction histidine kinase